MKLILYLFMFCTTFLKLTHAGGSEDAHCGTSEGGCDQNSDCWNWKGECSEGRVFCDKRGESCLNLFFDCGDGYCLDAENVCKDCRTQCVVQEQCDLGGENEDFCRDNCDAHDCSCNCETGCAGETVEGYTLHTFGCVEGANIHRYSDKTAQECADLCDDDNDCLGFELGRAYGGSQGSFDVGDCQLSSGDDRDGCNGASWNLDFYAKIADCIPNKTQACAKNAEARAASNAEARAASNAEAHAASSASSAAMARARNPDIASYEVYYVATYLFATVGLAFMVYGLCGVWRKCRGNKDYETANASTEEI